MEYQTGFPPAQCTLSENRMKENSVAKIQYVFTPRQMHLFHVVLLFWCWYPGESCPLRPETGGRAAWPDQSPARSWSASGSLPSSRMLPSWWRHQWMARICSITEPKVSKQSKRGGTVWRKQMVFFGGSASPPRLFKACGGEVLHDGHIDKVFGLWDDGENGLQVLSPRWRTERWWRTLGWNANME